MRRLALVWCMYIQPVVNKKRFSLALFQPILQLAWLQWTKQVSHSGLGPGAALTGLLAYVTSTDKMPSCGKGSAVTLSFFLSSSWLNFSCVLVEPGPEALLPAALCMLRWRTVSTSANCIYKNVGIWATLMKYCWLKSMTPQIVLDEVSERKIKYTKLNYFIKEQEVVLH